MIPEAFLVWWVERGRIYQHTRSNTYDLRRAGNV